GANVFQVADEIVADDFGGAAEGALGALLGAGLKNAAVAAGGVYEGAALADGEREGFFAVDVLAGANGGMRERDVPVVGRADEDDVHVGQGEDLLGILIDGDAA